MHFRLDVLAAVVAPCFLFRTAGAQDCVTSLADAFVTTRTCVDDRAAIGTDLKEIYDLLNADTPDYSGAQSIYQSGKNSIKADTTKRTIQGFSTSAANGKFDGQPTFNSMLYGLSGKDASNINNYMTFADDYVSGLLNAGNTNTLAYEAMVALNIFTYCTYELWDAVGDCENQSEGIIMEGLTDNIGVGIFAIDEFIAFYIGDNQVSGSEQGYSLYAMAQKAGSYFNQNDPAAQVNLKVKELYEEASQYLSNSDACTKDSNTVGQMHGVVNRIIAQMNIAMMQMLLHAIKTNDQGRIDIYARVIVPQLTVCKQSSYAMLKDALLDNPYDESRFLEIVGQLTSSYECLGFSCDDVGTYQFGENTIAACAARPGNLPMAGYSPQTDTHNHALIDLDIMEIKTLSELQLWDAAERLYKYGKHSAKGDGLRTLQGLAKSDNREKAIPYYKLFEKYHVNSDYADTFVMNALSASGRYALASPEQRKEVVVKTIQYQIMYMYVMYEFRDSVLDCKNDDLLDNVDSVSAFDEGAAFLIGSLEGITMGGSQSSDGMLHYSLGQKRADQFGTVIEEDGKRIAKTNVELLDLLWAGQAALKNKACDEVSRIVDQIQQITLVPLMQGVLRYALINEARPAPFAEKSKDLAEGEVFAKSILPLLCDVSQKDCQTVERNMLMENGVKPVKEGPQAVANALRALCESPDYEHLDCLDVGSANGVAVEVSAQARGANSASSKTSSKALSFLLAMLVVALL